MSAQEAVADHPGACYVPWSAGEDVGPRVLGRGRVDADRGLCRRVGHVSSSCRESTPCTRALVSGIEGGDDDVLSMESPPLRCA